MRKLLFVFSVLLFTININAQEVLDKIVAVVDDEVILQSELNMQVAYIAAQYRMDPGNEKVKQDVLQQMVEEKLLYAQAQLDSVFVTDEEVEAQLDQQLSYFINQYGSRERVEEAYGMSIERIRRELRGDVRKNLMAQRVRFKKFGEVEVTSREVEEFYETYQDSLGLIPERFTISHIFINPKATDEIKARAKTLAETLLDSIKNKGGDFAELAKEYSDDPGSASQGGDLGFVKRGVFYPEFESTAFALNEGQISQIIESPVGFHIIQLIERRGESINTRHILIKPANDDDADLRTIEFLSELRDSIVNGYNDFEYYAKEYSDDKQSSAAGGDLGTYEVSQLDKPLLDTIIKLKEGDISYPKRLELGSGQYGFHIVKLVERVPEHQPTLEGDYQEVKNLAEYQKSERLFEEWMESIKENIYWEIKI